MATLIVVLATIVSPRVYCGNKLLSHEPTQVDSIVANSATIDTSPIVSSCFFFAIGWGTPQGNRFEIGQNIDSHIVVGATLCINDKWSNDRSGGRTGVMLGSRFGASEWMARPFVLVAVGETFGVFTKSEYYAFLHLGLKGPTKSFIQVRPEVGLDATFANDGKDSRKRQLWFGFNLSIEYQFR